MNNLSRWEPAREIMTLREAMDHLFNDSFTRPFSQMRDRDGGANWSTPAIDMFQTEDDVVVRAAVPGFKADEVQINVTGDILTLKGELKQEEERKEKSWQIREHHWGAFERSITLPTGVVPDR